MPAGTCVVAAGRQWFLPMPPACVESAALRELRQVIAWQRVSTAPADMMQRSDDGDKQPPVSSLLMKFVQSLLYEQSTREFLNPSFIRYISHAENHTSHHLGLFASVVRHLETETVRTVF
jgi:hypothetical protein